MIDNKNKQITQQPKQTLVIKLGGAALVDTDYLGQLFQCIKSHIAQTSQSIVIVHGGGLFVDDLVNKLGFSVEKKGGLRVTPLDQIDYICGALAGTANKILQAQAKAKGLITLGMCLSDLDLCQVTQFDLELGCVGVASANDGQLLQGLLEKNVFPLVSSIGIDVNGTRLNVNADDAAVSVAKALDAKLILLSDVAGVLDQNLQMIQQLDHDTTMRLIDEKVITDGMIVKVKSALAAADLLGKSVEVASWKDLAQFEALLKGQSKGTSFLPTFDNLKEIR